MNEPLGAHALFTRDRIEGQEAVGLAAYAQLARDSAGRRYPEPEHPYRTFYQRDRGRVIHSRAFRRLEHKTQVFLGETGDHVRNRLTHTIEVASVARAMACALGANEDLAEVIALAHDLGHAPYGHCGEAKLDELMAEHGGFEHNRQSLRLVERLEIKYPAFPGLNLSYEVLEGLRKHHSGFERPATRDRPAECFPQPSLEAQLANLADEITYHGHDLDDGLDLGLIRIEELAHLRVWRLCEDKVRQQFPALAAQPAKFLTYTIRSLIDYQIEDVVRETLRRINEAGISSADGVRRHADRLASPSRELKSANAQLRTFLFERVYRHPSVVEVNARGTAMIEGLFHAYRSNPTLMSGYLEGQGQDQPWERTVCDYIAGMTDRFLRREFNRITSGAD